MEEEKKVNWSSPESGYTKEIDYESIIDETQKLPFGVVPITWKDGTTTYSYKGKEYTNVNEIPAFIKGTKVSRYDWIDKAGEFAGNLIQSSPTLRTVLPPVAKGLSVLEAPGETSFAKMVGDSAENWGIDRRIGETAAYLAYPGLGELKPPAKFLSQLDDILVNPSYGKFDKNWAENRMLMSKSDTPLGGGKGFKPEGNWQSKYTKNFSDTTRLQKYEDAAFKHRELRQKTAKKDLMKDFIFEGGKPYVVDDAGKKYLLVRRNKRVDKKNFISKKNYELLPEDVILDRLLKNSGWTQGGRELREIKRLLNKNSALVSDPKFYEPLIEHGVGRVYLEHKIARGQSWFWKQVQKDPNFAPWLEPELRRLGRNSEYNIRILFNQDYKHLKDGVERQLNVLNSNKPVGEKFIINIEDPQHIASSGKVDFAKMNNPGNITVLKAGSGEKVGVIPDYLMNLYSNDFKRKWSKNYKYLINRPGNEVPEFYRLYTKKVKDEASGKMVQRYETFEEWRKRVIGNRIDLILRKSSDTDALQIGEHVISDRSDFFELFDERSGWIEAPSTIRNEPEFLNDR